MEIPPLIREELIAIGNACRQASESKKPEYLRKIDRLTDILARDGIVHPRNLKRPEFTPK